RVGLRTLRAADVVGAGALERLDTLADVIARVLAVHVHPHDHVALRSLDQLAQAGGLQPLGVIDQLDPRIFGRQPRNDLARAIRGATICDQDLDQLARIVLRLHARDAGRDVALFIERGHRDRHSRLALPADGVPRLLCHFQILALTYTPDAS